MAKSGSGHRRGRSSAGIASEKITLAPATRRAAPFLTLIAALGTEFLRQGSLPAAAAESVVRSSGEGARIPRERVVRRTLHSDTRQKYLLYIPSTGAAGAPVFVTVHGISWNFEEHATLFAPFAERYGVVLVAPCFVVGRQDDYQTLRHEGRGWRADLTLDSILTEVGRLTGARTQKFCIFGFSGGAQFSHRYAMIHPERIERAALGSAGWYTFPDSTLPYPYGIGPSASLERTRFDPQAFLRIPISVFVGGADTGTVNLRQGPQLDRQQGKTRLARARKWTVAMRRAAKSLGMEPLVTHEVVPHIEHSYRQFMEDGGLGERVFGALYGPPPAQPSRPDSAAATGSRSAHSRSARSH